MIELRYVLERAWVQGLAVLDMAPPQYERVAFQIIARTALEYRAVEMALKGIRRPMLVRNVAGAAIGSYDSGLNQ